MYQSKYTGKEVDISIKGRVDPTFFSSKSQNNDFMLPHVLLAGMANAKSIVFQNVDRYYGGYFSFAQPLVTYTGLENMELMIVMAVTVKCDTINTTVSIAHSENDIFDAGATSSVQIESGGGEATLAFATRFDAVTNDNYDIHIWADKNCQVSLKNFQVLFKEFKVVSL